MNINPEMPTNLEMSKTQENTKSWQQALNQIKTTSRMLVLTLRLSRTCKEPNRNKNKYSIQNHRKIRRAHPRLQTLFW